MLYYEFKDYEEFKQLFGIIEHGNGAKSRRNKIMLALWKDRKFLRTHVLSRVADSLKETISHLSDRGRIDYREVISRFVSQFSRYSANADADLLFCKDMASLKSRIMEILQDSSFSKPDADYVMRIGEQSFRSNLYETDDLNGICEDGTDNAIRYRSIEKQRIFKMRAGRMFEHLLSCNKLTDMLPLQVKRWMTEEFVGQWIAYSRSNGSVSKYTLHVDDNFSEIYDADCLRGNFGSCMVNQSYWRFYRDSVDAKAAYLTDDDGLIVARCVIFTEVFDENGNKYRLAERQYSTDSNLNLQRMLISALIRDGHIDGYKSVGASCHDAHDFVDIDGNSLHDVDFHIKCSLGYSDDLSYQDSFKYYNMSKGIAYNDSGYSYDYELDTTEGSLESEDGEWSEYNQERIPQDEAYYVETREDYFYDNQVVYAKVYNGGRFYEEYCLEDDCVEIDGTYYYAGDDANYPESYGLCRCEECGEYCINGDALYSDITDCYYCCQSCMEDGEYRFKEDNWYFSEYDEDYVEDEDDLSVAMVWNAFHHIYVEKTIMCETLDSLMEDGAAVEVNGVNYIDAVGYDGEPVHLAAAEVCVA